MHGHSSAQGGPSPPSSAAAAPSATTGLNRRLAALFLLALSAAIYIGTAAHPALLDDADSSHAVVAKEILQRHDWVVLYMNGIRYIMKAPLQFWLVAATYKFLGASAFTTRLSLALAVMGLVMMAYVIGRRWFGERAGFYAGLVMCTSVGVFMFTRIMIPEAIYALELTVAFYFFLRAWEGSMNPRLGLWAFAVMCALAVLTLSLVGIVFPAAILFLFLTATKGWNRWRDLHLFSSTVIFLAIAVPWHIIAEIRSPGFFYTYFVNEQILRAIGHRYPPDYEAVPLGIWWAAHLAWFFPWSFFVYYMFRRFPRWRSWGPAMQPADRVRLFLFTWAGFIMFFFSMTTGSRMEYYSFGAWSAIAVLLGCGLARAEEERHRWLPRFQAALAIVGWGIAGVLCYFVWISAGIRVHGDITSLLENHPVNFYRVSMAHFLDLTPDSFALLRGPALMAACVFGLGFGLAWLLRRRGRAVASNVTLALAMGVFVFAANWAFGIFGPRLSSHELAMKLNQVLQPEDQVAIYGEFGAGASLSFYTNREVWIYNGKYNNLALGANYPDAPKIFFGDSDFPPFWRGPERVFLFVPPEQSKRALARLPANDTWVLATSGEKTIYVNQPLRPGQPTLAQLEAKATASSGNH